MADVLLRGCRSTPLLGYLKGLGVLRAVSRQADPRARARWCNGTFEVRSELDRDGLADFFLHRYAPPPVVSPWNGGSGFYPKDKQGQRAFAALEGSEDVRVRSLVGAIQTARAALADLRLTDKPEPGKAKPALLRELRSRLDDDAVAWLDTAIALTGEQPSSAPLLGSGGNEGRLEFGVNFAVAAVQTLGLGEDKAMSAGRRQELLDVSLHGGAGRLERLSVAHLDRDLAPGGLERGDFDALASPWDVLLGLEGAQVLAAGVARRHGVGRDAIVAPFTARATQTAFASAAEHETSRGELWLPLWSSWWLLRELEAVTREARAQVGGRRAVTGLDFARAAGELGVARGIAAFERFALAKRAGRDHAAVPAGRIEVADRPAVRALHDLDPWLERLRRYGDAPASARAAIRWLERAIFALVARGGPLEAQAVLEAMGAVEATLARGGDRAEDGWQRPPQRIAAGPLLQSADDGTAEFVVSAALASLRDERPSARGAPSTSHGAPAALREMLLGTGFDEAGRRSYAHGRLAAPARAPAVERLAALHARRAVEAERANRRLVFDHGRWCPLRLAGALATEQLDTDRVLRLTAGLALLDHGRDRVKLRGWDCAEAYPPVPALDLLALAVHGLGRDRAPLSHGPPGADPVEARAEPLASAVDEGSANLGAHPTGRHSWITRLRAGAVEPVLREALLSLHAAEAEPIVTAEDLLPGAPSGPGLAAALLLRPPASDLRRAAVALTCLGDKDASSQALDPNSMPTTTQGASP